MSIKVTSCEVRKLAKPAGSIIAFADLVLEDAICIKNIKVIKGSRGTFMGMPSTKDKSGEYRDIVYPINAETRKMLEDIILEEFNKEDDLI